MGITRNTAARSVAALTFLCLGAAALAADPAAAGASATAAGAEVGAALPGVGGALLRLFGAMCVVLGLLFGATWLARRWRQFGLRSSRPPELAVVEMKSLGSRQALWVVGYRRQRLLLASSPAGVTLVTHLPEAEADAAQPQTPVIDFPEALRNVLGRRAS